MEIKGFIETSFLDWPGKICAVLFLPSCNLRCPFCHNFELAWHPERFPDYPWELIRKKLMALRPWLDGVCITGGEPTLHNDLPELVERIMAMGLTVKIDTNGTRPQMLEVLISGRMIEYLAMDIKAPLDPESYRKCAGVPVAITELRKSMEYLLSGRVKGEFRTTVIPQWHTPPILAQMAQELKEAPKWTRQEQNPSPAYDSKGLVPELRQSFVDPF
jgi:pyruvate formate lyase activating enzyme